MTDPKPNVVDLVTVVEMLDTALNDAESLNSTRYEDDGKNSPTNRQVRDRLLFLSDSLELAAALVKAEYWHGRVRS